MTTEPANKEEVKKEESQQQEGEETRQLTPNEERASSLGWKPLADWEAEGNDPEDWKPAKVFLEHGDMIGKIRQQSRELGEAQQALRFASQQHQKVYEKGYNAALTQLRAEKRAALAEGDLVKADQIDEKIDQTKDELNQARYAASVTNQQAAKIQPGPDPEHVEWVQRNPWYNDRIMSKFADALAIEYIQINNGQVTPNQVRDFVEKEVKKEFPQRFKPATKAAPNPDGEGRATSRNQSGNGVSAKLAQVKAGMTDEQRQIMKTMVKATGMTEQKYLEMYSQA